MKLNIDFTNKNISVTEDVKLEELIRTMMKMFPDNWKEYTLCQTGTYNVFQPHYYWTEGWWKVNPYYVNTPYSITCSTVNLDNSHITGVANSTNVPTSGFYQVELTNTI